MIIKNYRQHNWIDIVEKAFDLISNLDTVFNNANNETKKKILLSLGKSFTILDGKIEIEPNDWLVPIGQVYPALEEKYIKGYQTSGMNP